MNDVDAVRSSLEQLEAVMERHAVKVCVADLQQVQKKGAHGRETVKGAVLGMYEGTVGSW